MNQQVLQNPIWHATTNGNRDLSDGNEKVRYFQEDISPFVGLENFTAEHFAALYDLIPSGGARATFTPEHADVPLPWNVTRRMNILQMVHRKSMQDTRDLTGILPLGTSDIDDMIALTTLTNPGPFNKRTIEFGNYHGIKKDGQLIAMAGFRLQPPGFIEISAVCTRPGYTGNGYAKTLLVKLIADIYERGKTPILHVKKDYTEAIRLYKSIGFEPNQELHVVVFEKSAATL